MPWGERDASKKTRKANTPKKRRQWRDVANSQLKRGKSEKVAIMSANAAVGRGKRKSKRNAKRSGR